MALSKISLKTRSIPTEVRQVDWRVSNSSEAALAIMNAKKSSEQRLLILVESMKEGERLLEDCHFFGADATLLPDTELLPYDPFSPQVEIISERLATLFRLQMGQIPILIVPIPTLMQRLAPLTFLTANVMLYKVGDRIDREAFRSALTEAGYTLVQQVLTPGEFAIRGAIIDLFPMGERAPLRFDFFDDEIDSIRIFNPETQENIREIDSLSLLPAREFESSPEALKRFEEKFLQSFPNSEEIPLLKEVTKGNLPAGIEHYLPLFFDETATLFDYLPKETTIIQFPEIEESALRYQRLIDERYERYRHDRERPLLPPMRLFLTLQALQGRVEEYPTISLTFSGLSESEKELTLPNYLAKPNLKRPLLITTESAGRRETLLERLRGEGLTPAIVEGVEPFFQQPKPLTITVGALNEGFSHNNPDFDLRTEYQFLGMGARRRYRAKEPIADIESLLTNLDEIAIGDPIIHLTHGIGRYQGLTSIDDTELVVIQYQDNAKLYLPVTDLDQLAIYSGSDKSRAPFHKLGSGQWDRARKKAAEKANDTAAELLNIFAKREAEEGHRMKLPAEEYEQFSASFPYETTPDQQRAIDEVIADLKMGKMDRVICGDVGFGKTEVAMRATFMAVMNGYQVAMLAPTTLLAEQHAQSFQDRFSEWPFTTRALSRFRKTKETRTILEELKEGKIDIIIGTHRLLSKTTQFHNLGLVIIDEEHRFGVRQKARLKELRSEVNFLAMTATPIPRTLNMGLSGLKSLSIIATPPEDRIAVKTFVHEWSDELIIEACMREFKRGGQVYFLHNEVRTIESVAERLREMMPDLSLGIAHGQMHEDELERVMLDFYHHRINLLLSTTIIESGIDVPNANTMIINQADHLGLAQLHQIRGRVGRSHNRAYCYLIVPDERAMTADAKKRIDAIMHSDKLGAGFMLANHDLEIRGAGELLGENQSGEIHAIGFSLYMELLSRAVELVKEGESLNLEEPFAAGTEINLGIPALLPDHYIFDVSTRLSFYKRIASAKDSEALDQLQIELIDTFGLLPDPAKLLFALAEIKLRARPLNFQKIEAIQDGIRITFGPNPRLNADKLIKLVQGAPHLYRLQGQEALTYHAELTTPQEKSRAILHLLEALT